MKYLIFLALVVQGFAHLENRPGQRGPGKGHENRPPPGALPNSLPSRPPFNISEVPPSPLNISEMSPSPLNISGLPPFKNSSHERDEHHINDSKPPKEGSFNNNKKGQLPPRRPIRAVFGPVPPKSSNPPPLKQGQSNPPPLREKPEGTARPNFQSNFVAGNRGEKPKRFSRGIPSDNGGRVSPTGLPNNSGKPLKDNGSRPPKPEDIPPRGRQPGVSRSPPQGKPRK
ncbi:basic salivary proline-rich protein 4-like [Spea bombifrons]|uniref:basic salivary proline-rich protein 4-like n=1 Tax=Spea bombifrons TaxID=233779 RepID=UPI002349C98E|nr:basic salivary proline-rich protein 4-like [Spea bombifrons]